MVELGVREQRDLRVQRFSSERSDSSASTTIQSPPPHAALEPGDRSSPPRTYAGSSPQARSACTIIPALVVLPWVPVTARQRFSAAISSEQLRAVKLTIARRLSLGV